MKGQCLCGRIRFEVNTPPQSVSCCHCSQCRKQSGHYWASAHVGDQEIVIEGDVTWFSSSPGARRGFCPACGSFLFWKSDKDDHTSFAMGALDPGHGLTLQKHIFTAEKGDYYKITDGVPTF